MFNKGYICWWKEFWWGGKFTKTSLKTHIADQQSFRKVPHILHKHTVVCCHQVIQVRGGYLEESKFQNCGRTYTDMLQNQSQTFLRVFHDCALVSHHKGSLKYNHACITLVNVSLIQLLCWLYTKLLKAKKFEIWYSTGLNSHKFIKTHLDYLKYETSCITHIQIFTHYMETTWINIWQLYIWWQPYKWNWWEAFIEERN